MLRTKNIPYYFFIVFNAHKNHFPGRCAISFQQPFLYYYFKYRVLGPDVSVFQMYKISAPYHQIKTASPDMII